MSSPALTFNSRNFLKRVGAQTTTRDYQNRQAVYSQGDSADAIFCIRNGNVMLETASEQGKKAVIAILGPGDIFGEGCLGNRSLRISTASAIQSATIARVGKAAIVRLIHQQPAFAKLLISYMIGRMVRIEEDFVDRLFNFSEKRLARILMLLSVSGKNGEPDAEIPRINQQHLAQMVGTTRSRVSHFMNKFRKLGLVNYTGTGALTVNSVLLRAVLLEQP